MCTPLTPCVSSSSRDGSVSNVDPSCLSVSCSLVFIPLTHLRLYSSLSVPPRHREFPKEPEVGRTSVCTDEGTSGDITVHCPSGSISRRESLKLKLCKSLYDSGFLGVLHTQTDGCRLRWSVPKGIKHIEILFGGTCIGVTRGQETSDFL